MRARNGLAAVLLAGAGGVAALGPVLWVTAMPAAALTRPVNIVDKAKPDPSGAGLFDPNVIRIDLDTKLLWTNKTSNRHTVTSDPGSLSFDSGDLKGPGGQFEFRFQTAGTYTYHCTRHPQMVGRVEVVDPNAPTTTTTAPPPTTTAPPTTTTTAPPVTTTTAPPTTTTTETRPAFALPAPPTTAAPAPPPAPSTTSSVPSTTTTTTVAPTTPTSVAPVLAGGEEGTGPPPSATTAPPPTTATTQPPGGDKNQNAAGPVSSDGKLDVAAVALVSALVAVGAFGAWTLIRVRPGRT